MMADVSRVPDTHITEDMPQFEIMADYLVVSVGRCTCDGPFETYGHRPECGYEPVVKLDELQQVLCRAGHEVVQLPEADRQDDTWASWAIRDGEDVIDQIEAARKDHHLPITHGAAGVRYSIEYAEKLAGTLLAAAREARRLSGGSQVGDQP